jgi:hypothetical protein
MKLTVPLAALGLVLTSAGWAAEATTPVDYTQRNEAYAPTGGVPLLKKELPKAESLQERRFDKQVTERKMLDAPGARRAGVEVTETRDKNVVEKDVRQPEKIERQISPYNQKTAPISTAGDTTKPPTVAKFQDRLSAASTANMARFPALDRATGATINRFVFRKNGEDDSALTSGATVTPAGGPAAVVK